MATLVLGAAGAAIGGSIGGAILGVSAATIGGFIGSSIGSVVDSWIISSLAPTQRIEGARLDTLRITSATEGAVIPRLYGRMRMGGNIIWATDFREETKTTTQGGGKGGGGGKVRTSEYLYYASFAVALCEGPITGIGRIWADGKPMDLSGVTWRWYPGDETQTADPFIAAKMGAASTPAYRGTAYVVFEELALSTYGNRLPQLSFEVFQPLADPDTAEGLTRAVTMIPASGEFTYATQAIRKTDGGATVPENLNALADSTDMVEALDRLQAMAPAVESVSLVVAWFGDDLRAGSCKVRPGVEVLAKSTTPANWSVNGVSSAEMWQALLDARADEFRNSRLRDDGDVESALTEATVIEAEYRSPFLAHAALEPLSATVLVQAESITIWTATQIPAVVRDAAVELTGVDPSRVTVHALSAGGSFGRRLDHDYVVQAIQIAATMPGTPIKTTWSREEDMTHDFPRPLHMAVGRGAVGNGRVLAYDLDSISPSLVSSWFGRIFIVPPGPDTLLVWGAFDQPYAIPNYRVTGYAAPPMMPIGSWRSPGACSNSFFHESFLSELIHAAGADPLEERLRLIADADSRRVLEAVGEMSNWNGADIGPGRGRGIAFAHTYGVPVAEVIDVTMTDRGIRIDEVWIAADCGTVFDPVNAEAQLTGAAIFGLGHAMNCELTYENHAVQQTNFHAFEGMRLHQTPLFHTRLLERAEQVRGLGEPATAPAAPALADAIFAATGQRLREMPFNRSVAFA